MQRDTRQRRAIRQAVEAAGRPLSPREILGAARHLSPSLGIATVYRNLRAMVAAGTVRPVELPGAGSRYEVAGKEHHHHFHCRECDRVYEVEDCPGNLRALAPAGFRPEAHEIILYGLCDACAASA